MNHKDHSEEMDQLPDLVLIEIFKYINIKDRIRFSMVSERKNQLTFLSKILIHLKKIF